MKTTKTNDTLLQHLLDLLDGGNAHATFDQAVKGIPIAKAGERPAGVPHSAWELMEHMRIAQHDILKFSQGPDWVSPKWPEGYWPKSPKPAERGPVARRGARLPCRSREFRKIAARPRRRAG